MTKPLAKSLHTITVLRRIAEHLMDTDTPITAAQAVDRALMILGYLNPDDPHDLRNAAILALDPRYSAPIRQPSLAELQAEGEAWEAREERWAERAREV